MAPWERVDLDVSARDGFRLRATRTGRPPSDRAVLINSATAVPRRFYRHLAASLAEAGFTAITYDYRGIGDSRPARLRGFEASMRDWALLDMAGMLDWIDREVAPNQLFMVGHSVGGQVAGLIDNAHLVDGMVTFSAQSGHWRLQGGEQRLKVALHVHVTLPLLATVFGYMPWSLLGPGEDLPKGAAIEWSRWCRNPQYLLGDTTLPLERYRRFEAPVLAYSFGDDKWGTKEAVDALMRAYPHVERRHVEPSETELDSIGHFGFFRPGAASLWREPIDWLLALARDPSEARARR